MPTATVTSKGQITIPNTVRLALGLHSGDRVEFIELTEGAFTMIAATSPMTALKGLVAKPAKPISLEEMNETIAARGKVR